MSQLVDIKSINSKDWFILTEICNDMIVELRIKYSKLYFSERSKPNPDKSKLEKFDAKREVFRNISNSDIFKSKEKMLESIILYFPELKGFK